MIRAISAGSRTIQRITRQRRLSAWRRSRPRAVLRPVCASSTSGAASWRVRVGRRGCLRSRVSSRMALLRRVVGCPNMISFHKTLSYVDKETAPNKRSSWPHKSPAITTAALLQHTHRRPSRPHRVTQHTHKHTTQIHNISTQVPPSSTPCLFSPPHYNPSRCPEPTSFWAARPLEEGPYHP